VTIPSAVFSHLIHASWSLAFTTHLNSPRNQCSLAASVGDFPLAHLSIYSLFSFPSPRDARVFVAFSPSSPFPLHDGRVFPKLSGFLSTLLDASPINVKSSPFLSCANRLSAFINPLPPTSPQPEMSVRIAIPSPPRFP